MLLQYIVMIVFVLLIVIVTALLCPVYKENTISGVSVQDKAICGGFGIICGLRLHWVSLEINTP